MGYDLHITRREHWSDVETGADISLNEWLTYVKGDKELHLTNGYETNWGSESHFEERLGFCEWKAHPIEREQNSRPWFDYSEGCIDTKNPDAPTIRKMLQIAASLNAKVQGDDGEVYTEEYLNELENPIQKSYFHNQEKKKPWWKFW